MPGIRGKRRTSSRTKGGIGAFSGFGAVAEKVLGHLGLAQGVRQCEAVSAWAEAVGDKIAEATEARGIRDGVLQVACRSNVWANELSLLKRELLARLSESVGQGVVSDIRFSAARLQKKLPVPSEEVAVVADPAVEAKAEAAAKAVRDVIKDAGLASAVDRAVRTAVFGDAEKRALGWKECKGCGALHNEDGDLCAVCRVQ